MPFYGLIHPSYVKQPEYSPSHSEYPPYKLPRVKKSQPLSWLGSPRQIESLYNYQPHHHHLTVVKDLMSVRYVGGEQTTLNEVYIAYLNQVNVGEIEKVVVGH